MGDRDTTGLGQTKALLDGARLGEASARQGLLERLRPRLVLWASTRLSEKLRAKLEPDDVAQEILLAVHRDLESFRGEGLKSFYSWLFRLAENRVRDLAEHHDALKRQPVRAVAVSQTTPGTVAARLEELLRVRRAVESLSEDHRRVIQLRQLEEMGVAEVAELLGRSPNAVRVLHCRALKALRAALGEQG